MTFDCYLYFGRSVIEKYWDACLYLQSCHSKTLSE